MKAIDNHNKNETNVQKNNVIDFEKEEFIAENAIKKKNSKAEIIKNNLIFLIGIFLLVYKGLFLNYVLNLQIEAEVVFYTLIVSLLIMCPAINNKNKTPLSQNTLE